MLIKTLKLGHKVYKVAVSPLLGNRCRFYPSCSNYAIEAIERHGLLAGSVLSAYRICRCNPLCDGGVDEVPDKLPLGRSK